MVVHDGGMLPHVSSMRRGMMNCCTLLSSSPLLWRKIRISINGSSGARRLPQFKGFFQGQEVAGSAGHQMPFAPSPSWLERPQIRRSSAGFQVNEWTVQGLSSERSSLPLVFFLRDCSRELRPWVLCSHCRCVALSLGWTWVLGSLLAGLGGDWLHRCGPREPVGEVHCSF